MIFNLLFMGNFIRCRRWERGVSNGGTRYYPLWWTYATGVWEKEGHETIFISMSGILLKLLRMEKVLRIKKLTTKRSGKT